MRASGPLALVRALSLGRRSTYTSAVLWLSLAFLSAIALGLYDVAKKSALDDNSVLGVLVATSLTSSALLGLVVLAASSGFVDLPSFRLVELSFVEHLAIVGKSTLVSASWLCTFVALKHLPLSLAAPLRASAPLFTLLGAFVLFGERPSALAWLGIALVWGSYVWFSALGRKAPEIVDGERWIFLLLIGTLLGASSGLYDKHLLGASNARLPPTTLQFWFTVYHTVVLGAVAAYRKRSEQAPHRFRFRPALVGVSLGLLVADQLYFRALATPGSLVAVVSLVRRSSVIVAFSVGGLVFREKDLGARVVPLLTLLLGLVILVLGHRT